MKTLLASEPSVVYQNLPLQLHSVYLLQEMSVVDLMDAVFETTPAVIS